MSKLRLRGVKISCPLGMCYDELIIWLGNILADSRKDKPGKTERWGLGESRELSMNEH